MKVLSINGHFLLPDDFKGTVAEAMRLMADLHESNVAGSRPIKPKNLPSLIKSDNDLWEAFLLDTREGFRLRAVLSLAELNRKTFKWEHLPSWQAEIDQANKPINKKTLHKS